MGYKVMGMVVTQLGFEIPMRDQTRLIEVLGWDRPITSRA